MGKDIWKLFIEATIAVMNTKTHTMRMKMDWRLRSMLSLPTFPREQDPNSVIGRRRHADREMVNDS